MQRKTGFLQFIFVALLTFKVNAQNIIQNEYYADGSVRSETPFSNGKINGIVKWYFKGSGKLKEEDPYSDGKINGIVKWYNEENGVVKEEDPYVDGTMLGIAKLYYASGKLQKETPFTDGKINGTVKLYYESGKLQKETPFTDGKENGVVKLYYESEKIKEETPYTEGKINGIKKEYCENGTLSCETPFTNDKKNKTLNIWINYINQVQGWSALKSNTFLYKLNLVNFSMAPDIRIKNERIFDIEKRTTALTDKDKPDFVEYPQQVYTDENGKNLAFFQRLKTNCKDVCTTSIYDMAMYSMNENGVIDSVFVEPLNLFIPYSSLDEKDYSFRNTDWERGKSGLFASSPSVVNQIGMMSVKYLDFIFTLEGNKYVVYNDLPSNILKVAGEKVEEYKKANDGEACIMEVNSANVMKRNLLSAMGGSSKKTYLCMLTSDYNSKTKTFTSVYVDKESGDAHIIWFKL